MEDTFLVLLMKSGAGNLMLINRGATSNHP